MKKLIINSVLYGFLLVPVVLWLVWFVKPAHKADIIIVDKSVLTIDGVKHRAFNWILTHRKYKKPDGKFYSVSSDYLGFFPLANEQFEIKDLSRFSEYQLDSLAIGTEMIFFADTYGVYKQEWYKRDLGEDENSKKLYGGLDTSDVSFIKKMIERKKLVMAQFNFFATPTSGAVRAEAENLLNLRWSGWSGRYYGQLDTLENPELPKWIVSLYKKQHNNNWPFTKSGIVFIHSDETIEILEEDTDLEYEVPVVKSFDYTVSKYSVARKVNYSNWFDIVLSSNTGNRVLSYYEIQTNSRGDSILQSQNIPKIFPAAFENEENNYYYFCGDFMDSPVYDTPNRISGIQYFKLFVLNEDDKTDKSPFFWKYTLPLTSKILNNHLRN